MDPAAQFSRLQNRIFEKGFGNSIELRMIDGEMPSRTMDAFGNAVISVSSTGSGPMYNFKKILGAVCVCIGGSYIYNKAHSPNEFARLDLINKSTKCMANIMQACGDIG
jgi:hypothetical protein